MIAKTSPNQVPTHHHKHFQAHTLSSTKEEEALCTTEDTKARHPDHQATLSSHHCNGLREDTGQCWVTAFLRPPTVLYAMIKNCILPSNVLALTAGPESKSFGLAAVLHSPVSGFANHVNNSCFVKKHLLISVNSNKDFANPQSCGKQAGHNHFKGIFYILMASGSNALPELAAIGTRTL